jgi:hypothetical protein
MKNKRASGRWGNRHASRQEIERPRRIGTNGAASFTMVLPGKKNYKDLARSARSKETPKPLRKTIKTSKF